MPWALEMPVIAVSGSAAMRRGYDEYICLFTIQMPHVRSLLLNRKDFYMPGSCYRPIKTGLVPGLFLAIFCLYFGLDSFQLWNLSTFLLYISQKRSWSMRYFNDFYKSLTIASNGRNVKRQRQKQVLLLLLLISSCGIFLRELRKGDR